MSATKTWRPRSGWRDDEHGFRMGSYFKGHSIADDVIATELGAKHFKRVELHLRYLPRIKWCEQVGFPCDEEGEWHSHYADVRPGPGTEYTFAWETDE